MITKKGLIIGVTELEDKGRYLRVLTDDGVHEVYARGAKKITSKNNAGTEIFCYSRLCATPGKNGLILDSSEPERQFYNLRFDIKKLALANYFAEVVMHSGIGTEKTGETLNLFLLCLYYLDAGNRETALIKAVFELRYACEIGFMPGLIGCDVCHKYDEGLTFVIKSGKLYCEEHLNGTGYPLSPAVLHALRFVCLSELKKICDFKLSPEAERDLARIAENYLIYHTEKHLKSLTYYNRLS
ncbi:MAG: DNA repair protein RecO [Ruminococcus sp.]|jgi:DNA repair protein RecO (recombination protein O)|nr:DNA repair protein RecO [Ruminococcus sp.]